MKPQIGGDSATKIISYQYDNHLGSASLELNKDGGLISYEEYHPFGTTSYRSGKNDSEVSLKRYKYVGKERDEETGFYYYGVRYYSAWLGRFVSVDPLQFDYPYYTPYQYAGNKPITFIDLDGLEEAKKDDTASNNVKGQEERQISSIENKQVDSIDINIPDNPSSIDNKKLTGIFSDKKGGIKLDGDKRDINKFIRQLNRVTGNSYGIGDDGFLFNKTGENNVNTNKRKSGELSKIVFDAMNGSEVFTLGLVRNSDNVLIDSYDTAEVDVGDFAKMSRIMKAGQFAHFLSERMGNPTDYSVVNRTRDNFDNVAHPIGMKKESEVVNAMLGQENILVVQNDILRTIKDDDGYTTGVYYEATSTYGDVKFGFEQNARLVNINHNTGRAEVEKRGTMLSRYKKWK